MAVYFAVIHKDATSDYGISFPDLPGCVSAASSLEELDIMGREALKLHIEGMLEDKESLPTNNPPPMRDLWVSRWWR